MALIGTISGSVGASSSLTSTTAISGTLVIANVRTNFPVITSDAVLFVSGTVGGTSKSVFGGDLVVSGNIDGKSGFSLSSATSTGSFSGDLAVAGRTTLAGVTERMTHAQGGSTLTCDMTGSSIFYLNRPAGNVTANFTNVPTTDNRIITPTVILSQSSPAYIVSIVQVDGAGQTINWANGTTPTGTANKQDVFGFSLIRSGSAWKVLGQMSTYG
jgi:hypothetical protein